MERRVYLAGPITGLSYSGCTDWREFAKEDLRKAGIVGVSPMRAKEYLAKEKSVADSYENQVLSCSRGITTRDRFDTTTSDILFANFLGAKAVSIGTVIECSWADLLRIPIIGILEKEGNPHDHAMLREMIGFRVETLEEGLSVAKAILTY